MTSTIKQGSRIAAKKMIMVVTGETKTAYLGYYEYKGKAVGQCSLLKETVNNPHFSDDFTVENRLEPTHKAYTPQS